MRKGGNNVWKGRGCVVKGGAKCRNELVMFGKERAPSGKDDVV